MRWRLRGSLLAALLGALAPAGASADVFVVDTSGDGAGGSCSPNPDRLPTLGGSCSLRRAIEAANASAASDTILFAPAVFDSAANKVITLASPLPDFDGTVEINGVASGLATTRVEGIVVRAGTGVGDLFAVVDGDAQLDDVTLENGDVAIGAGTSLAFDQTANATFAGVISGDGDLAKDGAARLVLTGLNGYTGDTIIEEGALQGDTRSINPNGDVEDDGLVVFDQANDDPEDFFGAISGSGALEKTGAGSLFLRTPNSYSGGTTVTAGTLKGFAGSAAGTSTLQGNIVNNATLVFEQAADGTFAGAISGSGRVEKTGPGRLVLTGSNAYAGGTQLRNGTLRGAAGSLQGDVAIDAAGAVSAGSNARLVFDQAGTATFRGDISGGGGLASTLFDVEKTGAGTLTLDGTNTYLGGTLVSGGALRGTTLSLQGDIEVLPGTQLVFDQSFDGAYAGLLSGPGAAAEAGVLEKRGSGTLVLTRDWSGSFLGDTTVAGGRLDVGRPGDGVGALLPGAVDVLSGGVLGGIGGVGGLATVRSRGVLSPGNSIGTLTVGSAIFDAGLFEVEVTPTTADRLDVIGTAQILVGSEVRLLPGPGTYPAPGTGTPVVILEAGTLAGTFRPILPGTFAFLDAELDYTATQVLLTVESNGLTLLDYGDTRNQREVAQALVDAQAQVGHDPDLDDVFAELNTLLADDIDDALDAMSGEPLTGFPTARLAVGERFHGAVQDRIRAVAWRESDPLFAERGARPGARGQAALPAVSLGAGGPVELASMQVARQAGSLSYDPPEHAGGVGVWLDGYGLFGDITGGSGTDDLGTTIWGTSLGADLRLAESWVVGAAGGYAHSDLDYDSLDASPTIHTAQAAAYAGWASARAQAGAAFRFAWSHMDSSRGIAFAPPSTFSRDADADFDGIDLGARVEGALSLATIGGFDVQPLASFTYTHLEQDAFDESGAGSLDLSVDEQTLDSAVSGLGARLRGRFALGEDRWLRPELHARWLHEFGDTERTLDARIGGTPGATFSVRGAELARDTGVVGAEWTLTDAGRLHVFAGYDLAINPDLLQHSVSLGFELVW
jgi:outer membrane autotransporter protein/CSLREA domain-containing protein